MDTLRRLNREYMYTIWQTAKTEDLESLSGEVRRLATIMLEHEEYHNGFEIADHLQDNEYDVDQEGNPFLHIAIHAVDFIPWTTGLEFATVNAARCWNAFAPEHPCFKDGAQLMLTMNNGCGVIGDVSYHMPDGAGYTLPFYWRVTFWGRKGVLESGSLPHMGGLLEPEADGTLRGVYTPATSVWPSTTGVLPRNASRPFSRERS